MATIVLSDLAPSDAKHFSLGQFEIDVPTETDDLRLLAEANVHPWLHVELDEPEETDVVDTVPHVRPEDDPFSAQFEGELSDAEVDEPDPVEPLAVNAGLDQSEAIDVGFTGVTLAADTRDDDEPAPDNDKPAPQSRDQE